MEEICKLRDEISAIWHSFLLSTPQPRGAFRSIDHYEAFCTAKDLIQDTSEGLLAHRRKGFVIDQCLASIEFWGVMQTVSIQQDAISELNYALSGCLLKHENCGSAWPWIRDQRHLTTGHPSRKQRNENSIKRCVMVRGTATYAAITLQFHSGSPHRIQTFNLAERLDDYEKEACAIMTRQKEQLAALIK